MFNVFGHSTLNMDQEATQATGYGRPADHSASETINTNESNVVPAFKPNRSRHSANGITFNYPYQRTLANGYYVHSNLNSLRNFLQSPDCVLNAKGWFSTNDDSDHARYASDMVCFYLLYSILHAAGYVCNVQTSSDVKVFSGDVYTTKYATVYTKDTGTRNGAVPEDNPDDNNIYAVASPVRVVEERGFIAISPRVKLMFKDGCVPTLTHQRWGNGVRVLPLSIANLYVSADIYRILVPELPRHPTLTAPLNRRKHPISHDRLIPLAGYGVASEWWTMGKVYNYVDLRPTITGANVQTYLTWYNLPGKPQAEMRQLVILPLWYSGSRCWTRWFQIQNLLFDAGFYEDDFVKGPTFRPTGCMVAFTTQQGMVVQAYNTEPYDDYGIYPLLLVGGTGKSFHAAICATHQGLTNGWAAQMIRYNTATVPHELRDPSWIIETGAVPLSSKLEDSCHTLVQPADADRVIPEVIASIVIGSPNASVPVIREQVRVALTKRHIEMGDNERNNCVTILRNLLKSAQLVTDEEALNFTLDPTRTPGRVTRIVHRLFAVAPLGSLNSASLIPPLPSGVPGDVIRTAAASTTTSQKPASGGGDEKPQDKPTPASAPPVSMNPSVPAQPSSDKKRPTKQERINSSLKPCEPFLASVSAKLGQAGTVLSSTYPYFSQTVIDVATNVASKQRLNLGHLLNALHTRCLASGCTDNPSVTPGQIIKRSSTKPPTKDGAPNANVQSPKSEPGFNRRETTTGSRKQSFSRTRTDKKPSPSKRVPSTPATSSTTQQLPPTSTTSKSTSTGLTPSPSAGPMQKSVPSSMAPAAITMGPPTCPLSIVRPENLSESSFGRVLDTYSALMSLTRSLVIATGDSSSSPITAASTPANASPPSLPCLPSLPCNSSHQPAATPAVLSTAAMITSQSSPPQPPTTIPPTSNICVQLEAGSDQSVYQALNRRQKHHHHHHRHETPTFSSEYSDYSDTTVESSQSLAPQEKPSSSKDGGKQTEQSTPMSTEPHQGSCPQELTPPPPPSQPTTEESCGPTDSTTPAVPLLPLLQLSTLTGLDLSAMETSTPTNMRATARKLLAQAESNGRSRATTDASHTSSDALSVSSDGSSDGSSTTGSSRPPIIPLGMLTKDCTTSIRSMPSRKSSKPSPPKNTNRRQNNRSHPINYTAQVNRYKSVAAAVPQNSSAFLRTVLDPAHMIDYGCMGIPDANNNPTLTLMPRTTHTVPTAGTGFIYHTGKWNLDSNNKAANIVYDTVYLIMTEVVTNLIVVHTGSCDYNSVPNQPYCLVSTFTDDVEMITSVDDSAVRLIARGMTISHVGEMQYRGGYFDCLGLTNNNGYVMDGNTVHWSCPLQQAVSEQNFEGSQGVYCVLKPNNEANYKQWRNIDTKGEQLWIVPPNTPNDATDKYIRAGITGLSLATTPAFAPSVVKFIPPAPWKAGTANWSLRVSVYTAYEYRVVPSMSHNLSTSDPATIATMFALMQHHTPYYPASYNDFKKIMAKIREIYNQYKPLIDVAAGFVPYGNNINAGVDALLNATGGKQKKVLRRRM